MEFWGVEVKSGQSIDVKIREGSYLHLTQPSSSIGPFVVNNGDKDHDRPPHLLHNPVPGWGHKMDHHPNMPSRSHENGRFMNENDHINHPQKLSRMEDGKAASFSISPTSASVLALSQTVPSKTGLTEPQKQNHQVSSWCGPIIIGTSAEFDTGAVKFFTAGPIAASHSASTDT